jgi:hypothetical protein
VHGVVQGVDAALLPPSVVQMRIGASGPALFVWTNKKSIDRLAADTPHPKARGMRTYLSSTHRLVASRNQTLRQRSHLTHGTKRSSPPVERPYHTTSDASEAWQTAGRHAEDMQKIFDRVAQPDAQLGPLLQESLDHDVLQEVIDRDVLQETLDRLRNWQV